MSKIKKILLIAGGIVGVLIVVAIVSFFLLTKSLCSTDAIHEYPSPSGKDIVYQTVKNCGATTDFVTSLTLGTIKPEIISIKGSHETDLSIQWIDDKSIIVNYAGDSTKIYDYKTDVSGIKVKYMSGDKELEINCTYYDCEEKSRQLEIQRRKEWCDFSPENRTVCDSKAGWETCNDESWCHYNGPNQ